MCKDLFKELLILHSRLWGCWSLFRIHPGQVTGPLQYSCKWNLLHIVKLTNTMCLRLHSHQPCLKWNSEVLNLLVRFIWVDLNTVWEHWSEPNNQALVHLTGMVLQMKWFITGVNTIHTSHRKHCIYMRFSMMGTGGEVYNFWLTKQVSGDKTWGCDTRGTGGRIRHGTVSSERANFCNTFCLLQIASLEMPVYRNIVWPSVCRFAPRTRTSVKVTCRRSVTWAVDENVRDLLLYSPVWPVIKQRFVNIFLLLFTIYSPFAVCFCECDTETVWKMKQCIRCTPRKQTIMCERDL